MNVFRNVIIAVTNPYNISLHWLWILLAFQFPIPAHSQENSCQEFVEDYKLFRKSYQKSKSVLILQVSENLRGKLKFSNLGLPFTVMASFEFRDIKGYTVQVGEILTTNFADGSRVEIISSGRRLGTNAVQFTFLRAKDKAEKSMHFEDKMFYEKLRANQISSFEIIVDNAIRVIKIADSKSDTIKNIVSCLVEGAAIKQNEK